jgi:coenzyme F420-reducing hydrogenase beta subunit
LKNIAKRISENEKYVFIGTPCQCYGLRKVLEIKNRNNNFIFVDFFCHGFIPYDFFNYFLKKNKKDDLQKIEFRSKEQGWHSYLYKLTYKDNYDLIPYQKSDFGIVFLNDFLLPDTCYKCKFRYNQISSDIRVGDYWGEKHKNNTKGVSCVLGVTEKGKNILNVFFSKNLMYNQKINLQEIKDVKCGNNNGIKTIPRFNSFFKILYKIFGIKICLVFIKTYLFLRGRR